MTDQSTERLALADRMEKHVRSRLVGQNPDIPNSAWQMMLDAAVMLRATRRDEPVAWQAQLQSLIEVADDDRYSSEAIGIGFRNRLPFLRKALVHQAESQNGEAGASVITLATKLLDFIRDEGPSAKEWLPISETADALREAIASSPAPSRPAAQPMREALIEQCAKIAENQASAWVNGDARTRIGQAYQRACSDVAAKIRAALAPASANEVKP